MSAEDHLTRVLKLLQGSIRAAGVTQTDVDGRIGRRRGYLSHVFQRRVDLKLIDLLRVLDALGLQPGRFFQVAADGRPESGTPLEELMQLLEGAGGRRGRSGAWGRTAAPAAGGREEDSELMERVRATVRRILAEDLERGEEPASGLGGSG